MAQIQNSQLPFNDSATNGNVVDQTAWNQAMQVIQAAVNDNFYRRLADVKVLNADGTLNTTATLQASQSITNELEVQMGNGITITPTVSNGAITLQFSVANGALTGAQLANLTVTAQQIANNTITATQIANKTITAGQIADATITQTQLANGAVGTAQIQNGAVTQAQLANNSVGSAQVIAKSVPASNISETRLGDTQSALNDLNTRLQSAITSSSVSEVGDAHNSIPLSTSYATLKARLDSMDLAGIALAQKMLNSGVIDWNGTTTTFDASHNNGDVEVIVSSSFFNTFQIGGFDAIVNGEKLGIRNFGIAGTANANRVVLDAPPASNVTPSLAGSARDDLVFLEAWRDATTSEWQWRIRVVDGVDFATFPEGLGTWWNGTTTTAPVIGQGGASQPATATTANAFRWSGNRNLGNSASIGSYKDFNDTGIYVAGDGTSASMTTFNTYDGYSYAIPLFRVRRRNSTAFDPDTNSMGGRAFYSIGVTFPTSPQVTGFVTFNSTLSSTDYTKVSVGDYVYFSNDSTNVLKVVSLNGNNNVTFQNYGKTQPTTGSSYTFNVESDRPDGLYSNIIDASDIVDLRHQVSPTGFNYQALLEKNLDLLLRGQLVTNQTIRYSRDYIGLNTSSYTDDANTLLYLKFDGSINGTANGAAVTGSGSGSFVNGVQGLALASVSSNAPNYPISIASGSATFELEFMFKSTFNWNDGSNHGFCAFRNGSTKVMSLYKNGGNQLILIGYDSAGSTNQYTISGALPSSLSNVIVNDGSWHKVNVACNAGTMSMSIDGVSLTMAGGSLTLNNAITLVVISYSDWNNAYANCPLDLVRISNVVRSETLLPSNFALTNGDRILDGPDGDFSMWSDDVGGTSGTGGRTNPYGLTHVPNQVAGRISYNGSEIRHYYGQGYTAGYGSKSAGINPTGSFESSAEGITVTANETPNGTTTTFTFNQPSNATGLFVLQGSALSSGEFLLNGSNNTPSSASIDGTGKVTATFSTAPASSSSVQMQYATASRHAHFVPSTKGFIIHDWTDETHTGDGTTTVFTTAKYKVTSVNHVRVNGVVQNGGYTVGTLNQSGAGTTVTFTTAPANGATIDIVYESIITPAIGDYVRVMYQHIPYQGVLSASKIIRILDSPSSLFVTSRGTGKVPTGNTANGAIALTANLPINATGDYILKDDSVIPNSVSTSYDYWAPSDVALYPIKSRTSPYLENLYGSAGKRYNVGFDSSQSVPIRGFNNLYGADDSNANVTVSGDNIPTSVPHLTVYGIPAIDDSTGEMYALVMTKYTSNQLVYVSGASADTVALDVFKLQGRPLIKAYGGVSA